MVLEEQGKRLVIDPGNFTRTLPADLDSVIGIVITHVHADHLDPSHIKQLMEHNIAADIFCTEEVGKQLNYKNVNVVAAGSDKSIGPFNLRFFGNEHAIIHPSWPIAQNVGVMIDNKLYYPGDSFTRPDTSPVVLALPVSAPWLKLAESMDFLTSVKPKIAFPTHNVLLSQEGETMVERMLSGVAQSYGGLLKPLSVGDSLEF